MPKKRACKSKTKAGKACSRPPVTGTEFCIAHSPKELRDKKGFGGAQPGSGQPRKPRLVETLREKVEAEIEDWIRPFYEGQTATRHVVVGNGPSAHVEEVVDIPTRMAASREIFDRIEGKPRQTTELTGADGGALKVSLADLMERAEE